MKLLSKLTQLARPVLVATSLVTCFAASAWAQAQDFPTKSVTIVVPYAAGTPVDLFARSIADQLRERWKQAVIVDNRPGVAQIVASNYVARQQPADGHTLMISVMPNVIPPALLQKQNFSGNTDFAAVAHVCELPMALAVSSKHNVNSLKEFVDLARANPGRLTYGSSGVGSPSHMMHEDLSSAAGIKVVHVPYKTTGNVMSDLLGGQIDFAILALGHVSQQLETGNRLKALGVTASHRVPEYPNIPTIEEQGVKGFSAYVNYFILARKGTPAPIVQKLNEAINAATATPAYASTLKPIGGAKVPSPKSAEEVAKALQAQESVYQRLVTEKNITFD